MNRSLWTAGKLVFVGAVFVGICFVVYFAGEWRCEEILAVYAQEGIAPEEWMADFLLLVLATGIVNLLITLGWILLALNAKINSPERVGKRIIWAIGWLLTVAMSVVVPLAAEYMTVLHKTGLDLYIWLALVMLLGFGGYYLGSLFGTPASYKYTPLGGEAVWG